MPAQCGAAEQGKSMSRIDRTLLALCSMAIAIAPTTGGSAQAQPYPNRVIRMIVPFPAGGIADLVARQVSSQIQKETGQSIVVDNRPGAGGNIGVDAVAKSAPDGHTIGLVAAGNLVINPFMYKSMPFNAFEDLTPVAPVAEAPQVVVIQSGSPARTLQEFIGLAKSSPGALHYGSGGIGTTNHLAGYLFSKTAGIEMVHVPYRGMAPAVTDLLAGRIQMLSVGAAPVIEHVKAGTLRPLAAAAANRIPGLPDLPTALEAGLPAFEIATWFGVVAPAKTPADIVHKLNGLIAGISSDAATRKGLENSYLRPMNLSPEQFKQLVDQDAQKWAAVVRAAGINLD
jgi:tripartite-type tricarboxylate transporter receptor subunit TctC